MHGETKNVLSTWNSAHPHTPRDAEMSASHPQDKEEGLLTNETTRCDKNVTRLKVSTVRCGDTPSVQGKPDG